MGFQRDLPKKVTPYLTIRNGWVVLCFLISIIVLVNVYLFLSGSSLWQFELEITSSLVTIYALALIMITSNKHLYQTSEKQTKTFVDILNKVSSKLEVVITRLEAISNALTKRDEEYKKEQEEHTGRLKPNFIFKLIPTKFLWISRKNGFIKNSGAKALSVVLNIKWISTDPTFGDFSKKWDSFELNESDSFYLDDTDRIKNASVHIKITYADTEYRQYTDELDISF